MSEQTNDFEEAQSKRDKESWADSSNFDREPSAQRGGKSATRCITFIDFFAGVGGFHKGLEQANDFKEAQGKRDSQSWRDSANSNRELSTQRGSKPAFSCVWASEWNKHAATIYKKNFPQTPLETKDIRLVKADDIPRADLLCAGFPCQPFSIAGKRKGFEEARGTLFYEILRVARDKRIPYLLLENVKGLLSAQNGGAFRTILTALDELGYVLQWQVLNSKNFGVPQNRERVFVVGCLGEKRFRQVFPLGEASGIFNGKNGEKQASGERICSTIHSGYSRLQGQGEIYIKEGDGLMELPTNTKAGYDLARKGDGIRLQFAGSKTARGRVVKGNSQSLQTSGQVGTIVGNKIRRLTPIECERLQGFPDNWTKGLSDTQRYKCMGNAVTVNVVEAIGRRMLEVNLFSAGEKQK